MCPKCSSLPLPIPLAFDPQTLRSAPLTTRPSSSRQLSAAELEASRATGREDKLHASLEEALREADALRHDLRDRDERNAASQSTIAALHSTIREMRDTSLVRGRQSVNLWWCDGVLWLSWRRPGLVWNEQC